MYIQDRLLCLSPASICLGQDDRYLHNVITSLTLYNLALVHHLLSRVAVCETSLMRARALYERVICVTSNWPTKDWLHCLILNNLADIHNELCAYDRSKDCLTMLANIAKKTRCLDDCAIVSDSEMQGINLNYALAQFHTPAPAA
jgi:hypothetical protein